MPFLAGHSSAGAEFLTATQAGPHRLSRDLALITGRLHRPHHDAEASDELTIQATARDALEAGPDGIDPAS